MKRIALALVMASGAAYADGFTTYHTVDWFTHHPAERKAENEWCINNTGISNRVPACANAARASLGNIPVNPANDPPAWAAWRGTICRAGQPPDVGRMFGCNP